MLKTEQTSTPPKRGLPPRTRRPNPWIYGPQDAEPPHLRGGSYSNKSRKQSRGKVVQIPTEVHTVINHSPSSSLTIISSGYETEDQNISNYRIGSIRSMYKEEHMINGNIRMCNPVSLIHHWISHAGIRFSVLSVNFQKKIPVTKPYTPNKRLSQSTAMRLRNMLKLPKAHRWVCFEFFYANIDIPLLAKENDFCLCLKDQFPLLMARKMSRIEWCKVRRLMGKPRRCSQAFLREERQALQQRREKVRLLQQRKELLSTDFQDLPTEIPLSLVIGTKVTARIYKPADGLFTGVIDAVDPINNAYRVSFDRPGLGSQLVKDLNVLSDEPADTIPLSAYEANQRKRYQLPALHMSPIKYNSSGLVGEHDPLLGSSPLKTNLSINLTNTEDGTYGGFPVKFLHVVSRLTKILQAKKKKVQYLKELNCEAEKMKSYGEDFPVHFQHRYANVVLDLEALNNELQHDLASCQQFCNQVRCSTIPPKPEMQTTPGWMSDDPSISSVQEQGELMREQCNSKASNLVKSLNKGTYGKKMVRADRSIDLIEKLTSLMLQIKVNCESFAENEMPSFEFKTIKDSLAEIKGSLDPVNRGIFQNHVEIHINHIESGLCMTGNLHAFHTNPPLP